jgi:hypothetical protein
MRALLLGFKACHRGRCKIAGRRLARWARPRAGRWLARRLPDFGSKEWPLAVPVGSLLREYPGVAVPRGFAIRWNQILGRSHRLSSRVAGIAALARQNRAQSLPVTQLGPSARVVPPGCVASDPPPSVALPIMRDGARVAAHLSPLKPSPVQSPVKRYGVKLRRSTA